MRQSKEGTLHDCSECLDQHKCTLAQDERRETNEFDVGRRLSFVCCHSFCFFLALYNMFNISDRLSVLLLSNLLLEREIKFVSSLSLRESSRAVR